VLVAAAAVAAKVAKAPAAAAAAAAAGLEELPKEFQGEVILPFDLERYPFVQALCAALDEPAGTDFSKLHDSQIGMDILACFKRRCEEADIDALGPRGNPWNARYLGTAQKAPEANTRYMEVYHDFLRTFVLDNLGTGRVAFQARPTFRCHLPGCGAPGRPHRDEDYKHARVEVNYWIPCTTVFGSNSLYAETVRGAGDFRAFELDCGRLVRFYGNQVWHYTTPNETDCTRVSVDFRVIREQEWSPSAFAEFKLGAYFAVISREGVVPHGSQELRCLQDQYNGLPPSKKMKTSKKKAWEAD